MMAFLRRVVRVARKPPRYVLHRLLAEARNQTDRYTLPRRLRRFGVEALLAQTGSQTLEALWLQLAVQPWPVPAQRVRPETLDGVAPGATAALLARAESACRHEVDLLGSGPTSLGERIDWDTDFKTGDRWPRRFFRDIPIVDRSRPSDIKVPWELSRLQWLLPVGQAYLLTGDERYSRAARAVLEQWIDANPVAATVNWCIAMEPALRLFSWIWLFRVFASTDAWADPAFRSRFIRSLYQHAAFVDRYLEESDVNGNHFTADCAALVAAGAFFPGAVPRRWLRRGWTYLEREIGRQILDDGVDFEASAAYHRLVGELFLLAAIHAQHAGMTVVPGYRSRLAAIARFVVAYTKPDGTAPLWGDADDARALPFGVAPVNDHRHLAVTIGSYLGDQSIAAQVSGGRDELLWLCGSVQQPAAYGAQEVAATALAFEYGGVYVLRADRGYVFIDCGPVGMAGLGGHGHNDALSFEAVLDGVPSVSDSGCYVYTASFDLRNKFRSTAAHNTPQVDGAELNRFISMDALWFLHDDAHPRDVAVRSLPDGVEFTGGHSGYTRLAEPVIPKRRISLRNDGYAVTIEDRFEGQGCHEFCVPLQLAPGWQLKAITAADARFINSTGRELRVSSDTVGDWAFAAGEGQVAPSYGVLQAAPRLEWRAVGEAQALRLTVSMEISART